MQKPANSPSLFRSEAQWPAAPNRMEFHTLSVLKQSETEKNKPLPSSIKTQWKRLEQSKTRHRCTNRSLAKLELVGLRTILWKLFENEFGSIFWSKRLKRFKLESCHNPKTWRVDSTKSSNICIVWLVGRRECQMKDWETPWRFPYKHLQTGFISFILKSTNNVAFSINLEWLFCGFTL